MDYPASIPLLSAGWSPEDSFHSMLKLFSRKFEGCKDFLSGPGIKTSPSNAGDSGSIPGWGTTIPHASLGKKKRQDRCNIVTNSIKSSKKIAHIKTKKWKEGREYSEKLNYIFNCRISEDFTISNVSYELLKGSDSQPCFTFIHAAPQRASLAG